MKKHDAVGLSNRDLEAKAVLDYSLGSLINHLFGTGLGGVLSNPVGGGEKWRFVHNMFAYYLFKTGMIGLILYILYFSFWVKGVWRGFNFSWVKFPSDYQFQACLVSVFIIYGILEAGFKSISFPVFLAYCFAYIKSREEGATNFR